MIASKNIKSGLTETAKSYGGALCTTNMTQALFDKRQFRAYREFSANTTIKFVAAKNFYLTYQSLFLTTGAVRMVIATGGTEGGTFTAMPTKFNLNTVGTAAAGSTNISVGGTNTGGTEREVILASSAGAGAGIGTGSTVANRRYLTAGTYYFNVTVTGTTAGMYTLEWEEEE